MCQIKTEYQQNFSILYQSWVNQIQKEELIDIIDRYDIVKNVAKMLETLLRFLAAIRLSTEASIDDVEDSHGRPEQENSSTLGKSLLKPF